MNRQYRILRMITSLPEGGVERHLCQILPQLNRSGFDVTVACTDSLGKLASVLRERGVEVLPQRVRGRFHPLDIYGLVRLIRERKIDLVHTHMYACSIPGIIAAQWSGVPVVAHVHSLHEWQRPNRIRMCRYFFRRANKVLTVSQDVRQSLIEHCKLDLSSVVTLYNGVNLEHFTQPSGTEETRRQWGIASHETVVGTVARLVPVKGLSDLLQAMAIVQKAQPDVCLLIVGGGELRPKLEEEAWKLELRVVFTGTQNDVRPLVGIFDLAVLSSHSEGLSNFLLEAMALSKPVAATRVGGNSEAVIHGETGLLVPPHEPQALAQAILEMLRDKDMRQRMGQAGRRRVEENFSLEKALNNTVHIYEDILNHYSPQRRGGAEEEKPF